MAKELDITNDPIEDVGEDLLKPSDVSEMDKFMLAKSILRASLVLFIVVMLFFALSEHLLIKEPMREIWNFSSQGLFGIINLIIGFYFGGKIAASKS